MSLPYLCRDPIGSTVADFSGRAQDEKKRHSNNRMPTGASLPTCIALGCSQKSDTRSGFHAEADTQQLARDFHEAFPHAFMEPRQPEPDRAKDEAIISHKFHTGV